ncbi:MAG: nitrogenase-stabilizing/protective protein NifW [Leptolyngbyaceae cyanobacterium MO_188.B28]|nr:nitrogenase-stabilizing/protective protein NifW [Leptolyngbyaceae cyanobacterium MO_188.B28]
MNKTLADFNRLVDAEEYFEFFDLPYDPQIVSVNRLHILQKFSQLIQTAGEANELNEEEKLKQYQTALQNAYNVFLTSTPVEQKLFKVFKEKPKNVVLISEIGKGSADK